MTDAAIDRQVFEELRSAVGEDFVGEVLETFFEDSPRQLAALRGALAAANFEAFTRAAHSLKSTAASFGARRLSALALDLEQKWRERRLVDVGGGLVELEGEYAKAAGELRELHAKVP